ncbi:beta-trefoil DNA-binding domain-containing protein [Sporodiniella umbellata]|nr:beta-trefoil DNA-binding domain-containing protein [Sporodiniella umbellata]
MSSMESLLNAIDRASPIELPIPKKRRLSMSIDAMVEQRQFSSPPLSPKQTNKVICYHASVAQKSYGTEKRFLCPPPIVMTSGRQPSSVVSVSVVNDSNQATLEQRTPLDEQCKSYFKYLYVSGAAKSKQFRLKVNLQDTQLYSNPISIISKPSKKIAKTRNASSCFFHRSTVSLFNRINSQTVRTKYMSTDHHQLCAKHATWSPFEIIVLRANTASDSGHEHAVSAPITYGTEILLRDVQTGVTSPPFILRKVEKGRVVYEANGLLSQMQKVALQVSNSKQLLYLNSNGKTIQNDHAQNVYIDYTLLPNSEAAVDDYLCWTLVGVSKFEQELQEPPRLASSSPPPLHPHSPPPSPRSIVPLPRLARIDYLAQSHTLRVVPQPATPLEYWLGRQGPLKKRSDLEIELPSIQDILIHNHDLLSIHPDGSRSLELPLLLSPQDGFMYHSSKLLSYHFTQPELGRWSILDAMSHKR